MPVDRAGRRAARIARAAGNVTWWFGLALYAVLLAALLVAPLLEGSGYLVSFDWNAFHVGEGTGPPAVEMRVSMPNDLVATSRRLVSPDTMRAVDPELEDRAQTRLQFGTRQRAFFYAVNLTALAYLAAALLGVYLLRSLLSDVLAGDVFTATNAKRVSWLGWLLIVLGIAGPQLEYWRALVILKQVQLSGADLSPADPEAGVTWLLGVLVLVIAAAWRYGAELQDERDLTV